MPEKIPLGTVLVVISEFEHVAGDKNKLAAVRHRAEVMVQLLNELIEFREKEATRG